MENVSDSDPSGSQDLQNGDTAETNRNSSDSSRLLESLGSPLRDVKEKKTKEKKKKSRGGANRSDEHGYLDNEKWLFRPPPRGIGSESYKLCQQFASDGTCHFGSQCVEAHSPAELDEWKKRFAAKQKKATQSKGRSFVDALQEKLGESDNTSKILAQSIQHVKCECDKSLELVISEKSRIEQWTFHVTSNKPLTNVALLEEQFRDNFQLVSVRDKDNDTKGVCNHQEWARKSNSSFSMGNEYHVTVQFKTNIFGTFRQSVIFAWGKEPFLRKDISVDVKPIASSTEEVEELKNIIKGPERWTKENTQIIDFSPPFLSPEEEDKILLDEYEPPQPSQIELTTSLKESKFTTGNYRKRMHDLLHIEEMAQFEKLGQFNVVSKLRLTNSYILYSSSTSFSTAKFALPGELFAKMTLGSNLSEDTVAGRLILTNCKIVLLSKVSKKQSPTKQRRVAYVGSIEDTGKNTLYIRLSPEMVQKFDFKPDEDTEAEMHFMLNRIPTCEMHFAVDRLPSEDMVFPDLQRDVSIPWNPVKQWGEMDMKLNPKQKEAVVAVTAPTETNLPPILICGPWGTGKTYTLGQAIKVLVKQGGNKILICTHSNSAADLYILDYLHPYIKENPDEVKLLRVYYRRRWVNTVHADVQKYCLIHVTETQRSFLNPTLEQVMEYDIVVVTLSTSRTLINLNIPSDHFTHVLIDEAAQALECETILPFALCSPKTKIVLAGDHMQLSPEVVSSFAREKQFNKSLLERLYEYYPEQFPCKIQLCENYRSHEAIIGYTSDIFYDNKLLCSGKHPAHDTFYPLTLFTARGEDVQDVNSTSFFNNAEVYEVVERVAELVKSWPKCWGKKDENSIGIVTPYHDQVTRIRSELRKRRLNGISVERVLNVQGKQFRAIFLSTVRSRKTCVKLECDGDSDMDFGFLSNDKMLNTAITRAQSLVAVVGDPVTLCSVGKCRKLWEKFIETCHKHHSFYGFTWPALRAMLDTVELKKPYLLNPLAPEFVPRTSRLGPQPTRFMPQQPIRPPPPFIPPLPVPFFGPPQAPMPLPFFGMPPPPPPYGPIPPVVSTVPNYPIMIPPVRGKMAAVTSPVPPPPQEMRPNPNFANTKFSKDTKEEREPEPSYMILKSGVRIPEEKSAPAPVAPPPTSQADSLMNLLPDRTMVDLSQFMQNESQQHEWFKYLYLNRGPTEAARFTEVLIAMKENPEFARPPTLPSAHVRPPSGPIHASELEEQFFQETSSAVDKYFGDSNSFDEFLKDNRVLSDILDSPVEAPVAEEAAAAAPVQNVPLYKRRGGGEASKADDAAKQNEAKTYANVLRNQQQHRMESSDPLVSLRGIGTLGSRDNDDDYKNQMYSMFK